jgi:hypothetical protein
MRTREQTIYPQSGTVRRSHSSLAMLLKGSAPAGPFFLGYLNTLNIRNPRPADIVFVKPSRDSRARVLLGRRCGSSCSPRKGQGGAARAVSRPTMAGCRAFP